MPLKKFFLLNICFATSISAFAQNLDQGNFNNWDFGPAGIHGNLRLTKTIARKYFHIEKNGAQTVNVKLINPAGITVNTTTITFSNGLIKGIDEKNQWGEHYNHRDFTAIGKNEFKVKDFSRGTNNLLPCKYAIYTYEKEMLIEIRYYSSTGVLATNKNGFSIIRYKRYDDTVRFAMIKEVAYFDQNERPVNSKATDYHKVEYDVDEHDNTVSEAYFDIHGEPTTFRRGNITNIRMIYDEDNNMTGSEFYGADQKLAVNFAGIAGNQYKYRNGFQEENRRIDFLGQVTRAAASGDGIAIMKIAYDSAGNKLTESFFDETGAPIDDHSGVHAICYVYSRQNMLNRVSYFDLAEKPSINRDKIHSTLFVHDSVGRIVEQAYYGREEEPVKDFNDRVYRTKFRYEPDGRRSLISYWKDSSNPMPRWSGAFAERYSFDEDGRLTGINFLNEIGESLQGDDGASMIKISYKDDGTISERQFLHDDKLIRRKRGASYGYGIIRYNYDREGRMVELHFFDDNQNPVNAVVDFDVPFAAHRVVFKYLGSRIIEQSFYDVKTDLLVRTIDCLKNDFLGANGMSTGRKNME